MSAGMKNFKLPLILAVLSGLAIYTIITPNNRLEESLFSSGEKAQEAHQWQDAVLKFEQTLRYAPESARGLEAAKRGGAISLFQTKDYPKAVFFYRHIVQYGQNFQETKEAQKKLAEVYYEKINNYQQAVVEYQRLLHASGDYQEQSEIKLRLARCYYYMANFEQAIAEVDDYVKLNPNDKFDYDMLRIKADALMAQKRVDDAIETYSEIEQKFNNREDIFQVKMNKSLAFEEKKDWDKAVGVLEAMRGHYPHDDIVDLKIKSILRRKARKKE